MSPSESKVFDVSKEIMLAAMSAGLVLRQASNEQTADAIGMVFKKIYEKVGETTKG